MPGRSKNGRKTQKRKKLCLSPESLRNMNIERKPWRRNPLPLQPVLPVLWPISPRWMPCPLLGAGTVTVDLLVSPFGKTLLIRNNLPTNTARPLHPKGTSNPKIARPAHSPTTTQEVADKVQPGRTETTRDLNNLVPLTVQRKRGEVTVSETRTGSLPVGGKLAGYTSQWTELFPQFPESLSMNTDSLQRRRSDTSSPSSRVTQQQQGFRSSSSSEEALRLKGHRGSGGHLITGLLQSSVSGSQTWRILPTNHQSQEI